MKETKEYSFSQLNGWMLANKPQFERSTHSNYHCSLNSRYFQKISTFHMIHEHQSFFVCSKAWMVMFLLEEPFSGEDFSSSDGNLLGVDGHDKYSNFRPGFLIKDRQ